MSTISCENSVFLHIPKCAGSAISIALADSQISRFNYSKLGLPHACLSELKPEDKKRPKWAVIRQPADWLRSFFAYRWQSDWPEPRIMPSHPLYKLIKFRTKDFNKYIDYVLTLDAPITKFFQLYIDHTVRVIRLEKWTLDLDYVLKLEPDFNYQSMNRVNPTNKKVEMTDNQQYAIWTNEKAFFSKYYACYYSV